jgi:nucleoside permease NupC
MLAGGILFYIYLFAMLQTRDRQMAWLISFVVWILFEVLIVSSLLVLVQHIVIPSFVVREVQQVKQKVVKDIRDFKKKAESTRAYSIVAPFFARN